MTLPRRVLLPLTAGFVACRGTAFAQAGRPRVGEVTALRGSAFVRHGAEAPRLLAVLDPLRLDDLVTTGLAARLACRLEGGVGLNLGERASLRLDRHVLAGRDAGTALRVTEGAVLLDVPEGGRSPVAMILSWARIGLRGTQVWGGMLDGVLAVFVSRGSVEVDAGGRRAVLSAGEGTDIRGADAPPGPVTRWGEARIARALETIR